MTKRKLIFFFFLLAGLSVLNYPFVSQWINQRNQSRVVKTHIEQTMAIESEAKQKMLQEARAYNKQLAQRQQQLTDSFTDAQPVADTAYENLLNPSGDGMMGYIEIPSIDVLLPVYHGTSAQTLQNGVGHLVQSSLPVGGADTHAVLSAHTGLANKTLFTDLDQLQAGDRFTLQILNDTLTYEVCEIETVLPYETDSLTIRPGRDLVTLVTCTPYGINSHRLLVTGTRVESTPEQTEAVSTQPARTGRWQWEKIVFGGSVLILLVGGLLLLKPEKKGGKRSHG